MGKQRKFRIEVRIVGDLWLDESVISAVDDDWRSNFYDLDSPEDVAAMIGQEMLLRNKGLSHLDGFANLPDDLAVIDFDYSECTAEEVKH